MSNKFKKYEVILHDLENKIFDNLYKPNETLPSESQLSAIYKSSRSTVRQALKILEEKGFIQRRQGYGNIVLIHDKLLFPVSDLTSYKEFQSSLGFQSETEVISFELLKITTSLAEKTGLPIGEQVVSVLRRRKVDGKFTILDWDLFLEKYVEGLTLEHSKLSIYGYLEGCLKLNIAFAKKEVTIDFIRKSDLKYLDLYPKDRLVVSIKSNIYLADNTLFQYTESRHQVDFFRFSEFARRKKNKNE